MNKKADPLIKVENLTKIYKIPSKKGGLSGALRHLVLPEYTEKVAVDHVNFEILEGESIAYIGSNGAGKSTTIKMLTGILRPTLGKVTVCGVDPYRNRVKNAYNIGAMFGQKSQLWWDIPIQETFSMLKDIYEIPSDQYKKQLAYLIDLLDIEPFLYQSARQLSLGQRIRADLAAAFLHDPQILFLDEPTIGLDVMGKKAIRKFLKEINSELRKTIILTSHDLEDIREVCDKIMIIDAGKIIYHGLITEMLHKYSTRKTLTIQLKDTGKLLTGLNKLDVEAILNIIPQEDGRIRIEYDPIKIDILGLLTCLTPFGDIKDFSVTEESIEDIVEKLYRGIL